MGQRTASPPRLGTVLVKQRPSVGPWQLVTLGSVLVVCLVGGLALGLWLDERFDTLPLFVLVGLGIGMICGFLICYVRIRRFFS